MIRIIALPPLLAGALGALGGWLWWSWWGPPPVGRVFDTTRGQVWLPEPFDQGVAQDFGATATYVILALGLGLLLGLVTALFARHRAVSGLVAVGVSAILAAVVMTLVGQAQSPPDPQQQAERVEVGTELPGQMQVSGWTPYLVWPVGALIGYSVVMLGLAVRLEQPEPLSSAPGPRV